MRRVNLVVVDMIGNGARNEAGMPMAVSRRMLWLGFGSILLLMVIIALDVFHSAQQTTARNAALMKSFRARDQNLDELRNIVIRSGTMIRDYLSETDESKAASHRRDLEAARKRTAELLDAYEGLESTLQRQFDEVAQARRELRGLAASLENAQEEERRKISRELHDEVGQSMSAMLVELGGLEATAPQNEAMKARLGAFRKRAEASVRSVRDMALLLRPSMLDDLGLVAALKWRGREVERASGLRVIVDADDAGDLLPDALRTCIYRIVQEALNNCVKHAHASSARVAVKRSQGALEVFIQDDGRGFDPGTEKGVGLLGMAERVSRLGGTLHVDSAKGHGAMVSVRLPIPPEEVVT